METTGSRQRDPAIAACTTTLTPEYLHQIFTLYLHQIGASLDLHLHQIIYTRFVTLEQTITTPDFELQAFVIKVRITFNLKLTKITESKFAAAYHRYHFLFQGYILQNKQGPAILLRLASRRRSR